MTTLKKLISEKTIAVPGAFNAASALLIERAGFDAVYVSGAALANSNGLPDTGLLSRDEVLHLSSFIIKAVNVPVIVDVDTGFGGAKEAASTARTFETIGAAAVQIEDQEFPKMCGHLSGKCVIPAEDFAEKIREAAKARASNDFLIIARTDAKEAEGLDGAVKRARLYMEAGADVIFPEALESKDEFRAFAKEVNAPLMANMTEFGKTPFITVDEFREMGYRIVLFPVTSLRAAMKAMDEVLAEIKKTGTQKGLMDKLMPRQEIYKLIGYEPDK